MMVRTMHAFKQPQPQPAPVTMVVLGDSLAYGLGATNVENGLAHLIFRRLREDRPGSTYANYAVPHSTMGDVLRHQLPHLHQSNAGLVLLVAGANDLRFTRDPAIIKRRFQKLLETVHDLAPRAAVVAGGMPDVTQTIGVPVFLKPAAARLCRRINDAMRGVVARSGDEFIDMFEYTSAPLVAGAQYMCDDGYHPADFGHAEIAERSYPSVAKALLRIP